MLIIITVVSYLSWSVFPLRRLRTRVGKCHLTNSPLQSVSTRRRYSLILGLAVGVEPVDAGLALATVEMGLDADVGLTVVVAMVVASASTASAAVMALQQQLRLHARIPSVVKLRIRDNNG